MYLNLGGVHACMALSHSSIVNSSPSSWRGAAHFYRERTLIKAASVASAIQLIQLLGNIYILLEHVWFWEKWGDIIRAYPHEGLLRTTH